MTTGTHIVQIPEYWESNPSRGNVLEVMFVPESFLQGLDDYENGRVTDIPEDF